MIEALGRGREEVGGDRLHITTIQAMVKRVLVQEEGARAALGDPLLPYEERVDHALQKILAGRAWTTPQRQWLEKIGKQLKVETVVDRDAFEQGLFKSNGGYARFDKIFDGRLAEVLGEIGDAIWQRAG